MELCYWRIGRSTDWASQFSLLSELSSYTTLHSRWNVHGIVDVWGARLDWVAFAPDFQALQQNEVYEEREDEFDIVVDGEGRDGNEGKVDSVKPTVEDDDVDITTISKTPAFDSDSEDETDVFCFDWKTDKILSEKANPGPKKQSEIIE